MKNTELLITYSAFIMNVVISLPKLIGENNSERNYDGEFLSVIFYKNNIGLYFVNNY